MLSSLARSVQAILLLFLYSSPPPHTANMRLTTAAALVALLPCTTLAHPALVSSRRDINGRAVNFDTFRLGTKADYSNSGLTTKSGVAANVAASLSKRGTYLETAQALVKQVVPGSEFRVVDDHYVGGNGVAHVNFKQVVHGLDIDNADFNVNVRPPQNLHL